MHNSAQTTTLTVLALVVLLLITSCLPTIPINLGVKVTPEQQQSIHKGKTTKSELLAKLGDPHQRIDKGQGNEQFLYISNVVNNLGGGLIRGEEFWVTFNGNVVSDFGERPTQKRVPSGLAR